MKIVRHIETEPDAKLKITYANGDVLVSDFRPLIEQGGVFGVLADPDFFEQVRIGERGRYIEWPGELDFDADALWLEARAAGSSAA